MISDSYIYLLLSNNKIRIIFIGLGKPKYNTIQRYYPRGRFDLLFFCSIFVFVVVSISIRFYVLSLPHSILHLISSLQSIWYLLKIHIHFYPLGTACDNIVYLTKYVDTIRDIYISSRVCLICAEKIRRMNWSSRERKSQVNTRIILIPMCIWYHNVLTFVLSKVKCRCRRLHNVSNIFIGFSWSIIKKIRKDACARVICVDLFICENERQVAAATRKICIEEKNARKKIKFISNTSKYGIFNRKIEIIFFVFTACCDIRSAFTLFVLCGGPI